MAVAFAFFAFMLLAFIGANDVADNKATGMYTIFKKMGNRC